MEASGSAPNVVTDTFDKADGASLAPGDVVWVSVDPSAEGCAPISHTVVSDSLVFKEVPTSYVGGSVVMHDLYWLLPGLQTMIPCPGRTPPEDSVGCPVSEHVDTVAAIIVHLNDVRLWTREQVADWLETLDVDLTFPTDPGPRPEPWSPPPPVPYGAPITYGTPPGAWMKLLTKEMVAAGKAAGKSFASMGYWLDEYYGDSYSLNFTVNHEAPAWMQGPLPLEATTPALPSFDELRASAEYPAPDPLATPTLESGPIKIFVSAELTDGPSYVKLEKEKRGRHRRN